MKKSLVYGKLPAHNLCSSLLPKEGRHQKHSGLGLIDSMGPQGFEPWIFAV